MTIKQTELINFPPIPRYVSVCLPDSRKDYQPTLKRNTKLEFRIDEFPMSTFADKVISNNFPKGVKKVFIFPSLFDGLFETLMCIFLRVVYDAVTAEPLTPGLPYFMSLFSYLNSTFERILLGEGS